VDNYRNNKICVAIGVIPAIHSELSFSSGEMLSAFFMAIIPGCSQVVRGFDLIMQTWAAVDGDFVRVYNLPLSTVISFAGKIPDMI
jgi:hypothetical protein